MKSVKRNNYVFKLYERNLLIFFAEELINFICLKLENAENAYVNICNLFPKLD